MLALGVGNAWAETLTYQHVFTEKPSTGNSIDLSGVNWNVAATNLGSYNSQNYAGVQIGTSKNNGSITLTSTTDWDYNGNGKITEVRLWLNLGGTSVTPTVTIGGKSATSDGTTVVKNSKAGTDWTKATKVTFTPVADGNTGVVVINVSTVKAGYICAMEIDCEPAASGGGSTKPAVTSIQISGELTKDTYEEGEELDLTGLTVQANYESGDPKDVTNEVDWSYTPNPLTKGTTSVDVTATYEGLTAIKTINDLTVTEHVVTPGTYTGNLNNVFFGCATGNNATEQSGKFNDVLVVAGCKSSASSITYYDAGHVRFYADSYLTLSVPVGYVIKSIVFTADGTWNGSITASAGTYDNNSKTWTGNAQEVKFSFAQQNRIKSVKVTYAADVKYAVNITTPSNGTLVVKEGSTVLTDGALVYEGTKLVVTPTPNPGYLFESLTVDGTPVDLTEGSYNLTMPAANVTIAATFKANEKPDATLTLSKNGETEDITGYKQDDKVTLPSITSDCVKKFVGWSANANCTTEPEYKAGDEYTLTSTTQTLYAVYADVEGGGETTSEDLFENNGTYNETDPATIDWTLQNVISILQEQGSSTTPVNNLYVKDPRWYKNHVITITPSANITKITVKAQSNAYATALANSTYTNATATANEDIVTITPSSANQVVTIKMGEQARLYTLTVTYAATASYSNYSTTCVAALDAPIFNPEAGTYNEVTNVTISATDGDVYYTLDGTTPTEESNKYTGPIVLNSNGTTTIKAIAISAESQSTVVSATYTIKLPLTTMDQIFAKATAVGSAATSVQVVMNNWVVTGATITNAYVTDGTKGFIIYRKDGHGFSVGNILSGTVSCKVQLYNGSAQLTELTSTTEGLTVSTGGVVTPEEVNDVTTLGGINTGSVIKINGVHTSDNIVNNVKLYNTLFSFTDLTVGQEYNVTGVYLQYNATKEILPRIETDIEEVVGLPTATISIENITLVERGEHTIDATITPDEAASTVTYSIKSGSEYISLSGKVITAKAVGIATITATIAEVDGVYHGTTKDFTVTVNEYVAPISGRWELVTDASKLQAGMEVIVAQYVEASGTIYTMGSQNNNNRASVESTVSGTALTPTTGTVVLTLADAGNGTFALQAGNGKYLYAASNTSNHLKETATINDNAKWSISITERKASVVAQGSNTHNTIRYNSNDKLFSCYASGQQDIALYAKKPAHTRTTSAGRYGTICLPGNIVKCLGATLYEVAGREGDKVIFDEVTTPDAGMPYIFLAHNAEVLFYCGDQTAAAGHHKSLYGTFTVLKNSELEGMYMVQNNKIVKCNPANSGVAENRAYFNGTELEALGSAPAPMPGRRRITMGTESENTATGTEDVIAPEGQTLKLIENGQLIIIRNGEKFNAQGMRL